MQIRRWQEGEDQPQAESSSDTPRVGEFLRRERILRQDSLEVISDRLKIRTIFLDAIERQAYEELPGEPYSTGFIRGWAKLYGLDVNALTQQFKSETQHLQEEENGIPEVIPDQTSAFRWPIIVGSIIAIVVISIGWHLWHKNGQENQEIASALPMSEEIKSKIVPNTKNPQQELADFREAASQPILGPEVSSNITSNPNEQISSSQDSSILFRATGPCWIEVKDQQTGTILVSQLMKEGESYPVPQAKGLTAKIGNPSALTVVVGKTTIAPIGTSGQPMTIDLNADTLLSQIDNN